MARYGRLASPYQAGTLTRQLKMCIAQRDRNRGLSAHVRHGRLLGQLTTVRARLANEQARSHSSGLLSQRIKHTVPVILNAVYQCGIGLRGPPS